MRYVDFLAKEREKGSCGFCAVDDDMIIIQNDAGYVTPALAPYGQRHVMIVPRKHQEAFLTLESHVRSRLYDLAARMMQCFYDQGVQEVVQLMRDSHSFIDGSLGGSTSGKSRKHCHIHIIGDVQIMPKITQEESDSRRILTDSEMRSRTSFLQGVIM